MICLGNFSLAIGTSLFILPFNIVNGGISGIAIVLQEIFEFNESIVIFIASWSLFFIGLFVLGKKFAIKTLLSTILYPIFVSILTSVDFLTNAAAEVTDPLLAALTGAILTGFGLGIAYRAGTSTGGIDVINLMLKKYFNIKLSVSTFVVDTIIIVFGLISLSLEIALYGILCVLVTSYIVEKITISGTNSYIAHIVSDKSEEINDYLIHTLQRGTTLFKAEGGLTKNEKKVIEVVFNEKEYYEIKKNINEIDSKAFISVYKSINTYGEGFEEIFIRRS